MQKSTELIKELPLMKSLGYDAFALYCQFYLETGNFSCYLTPHNNLAGMMPRLDCPFPSVDQWTHEWVDENGKSVLKPFCSKFVDYPTIKDFLEDYDKYIRIKFIDTAYPVRAEYKKYYSRLQNVIEKSNGERVCVYPSFSSSPDYSGALIRCYERLLDQQPELAYMIKT